ncbi:MAG: tryptophan 7-halogenase [Chloroflexi bacterium]|nr:tryptophan 7-halogenase [Chloroflexota bacterium]
MQDIPQTTKVLVIGGGPGGATAATLLARQGFDVTLLEAARFPRYHIGESLLPSILQVVDLLGAREKMEKFGFQRKNGAFLEWGKESWPLNFGELAGDHTYAFQVVRSDFDLFLLEHARSQGVKVFEGVEVRGIGFDGERPVSAQWLVKHSDNGRSGKQGEIRFEYLIDASGRNGVMANHYLKNRRYHKMFQNIAVWGYWQDAGRLPGRPGDIAVGSIPYGWLWGIPLHNGLLSVGVVMHRDALKERREDEQGMRQILMDAIEQSPLLKGLVAPGEMVSEIHTESDYSYAAEKFCGPGYFLVGDAAAFLDPLLSSGVHLATFSAMLAAAGLTSLEAGEVSEAEMMTFFEESYRQAYLRFLVFLSAFYDVGRGRDAYFWEAQRLTQEDVSSADIKRAFLKLVTGLKDMSDAQTDTHHFILTEMTRRIDENLNFRKDKQVLASMDGETKEAAQANARFFSSVEGLFSLNQGDAVQGLYLTTHPHLHLARIQ